MQVVLLAGGESSRFAPLSDKSQWIFRGKILLHHIWERLPQSPKKTVVVAHPNNFLPLKKYAQDRALAWEVVEQSTHSGVMAAGVRRGLQELESDQPVLVLGGNDFVSSAAVQAVIQSQQSSAVTLLAQELETYFPGGYLVVDADQKLQRIIEKPAPDQLPSNLVAVMVQAFDRVDRLAQALDSVGAREPDAYEQAIQTLATKGLVQVVKNPTADWQAIKYPWQVLEIWRQFSAENSGINPRAQVSGSAQLEGEGITIESGAKIAAGATIVGPCYIGKNCVIGQNTLVRHSHLESDVVVGFGSEVVRSYLAPQVQLHHAYVGDSVVDRGVNFGIFSATTNLRLDRQSVRLKIKEQWIDSGHTKLGAFVGAGTQVGGGALLMPGSQVPPQTIIPPRTIWQGWEAKAS